MHRVDRTTPVQSRGARPLPFFLGQARQGNARARRHWAGGGEREHTTTVVSYGSGPVGFLLVSEGLWLLAEWNGIESNRIEGPRGDAIACLPLLLLLASFFSLPLLLLLTSHQSLAPLPRSVGLAIAIHITTTKAKDKRHTHRHIDAHHATIFLCPSPHQPPQSRHDDQSIALVESNELNCSCLPPTSPFHFLLRMSHATCPMAASCVGVGMCVFWGVVGTGTEWS